MSNEFDASQSKSQIALVGIDLIKNYGKKEFYSVEEVKAANQRQSVKFDVACVSHAFFNTHTDFDQHHRDIGEVCDYAAMRESALESVAMNNDTYF